MQKKAQQAYELYLSGKQENSFFIRQLVNLELWARTFLDGRVERGFSAA